MPNCRWIRCCVALAVAAATLVGAPALAHAQTASTGRSLIAIPEALAGGPQQWTSPGGISSTLQVMLLLTVVSLAPAILLMTTSFVRILVVMGLLRRRSGPSSCRRAR
jgi:flagellar biosynthetic protein FliP